MIHHDGESLSAYLPSSLIGRIAVSAPSRPDVITSFFNLSAHVPAQYVNTPDSVLGSDDLKSLRDVNVVFVLDSLLISPSLTAFWIL